MSRAALALAVIGAPLAGCIFAGIPNEVDEEDFAKVAAPVVCDRIRECMRGDYEVAYFGMKDCEDEQEVLIELLVEGAGDAGCDYDAEGASTALHDIADMNCQDFHESEWLESLDLVWPDCII